MKKSFILFGALVIFLLGISSVSASLCRGDDGYWHDCSYFDPKRGYETDYYKEVIELKKTTTSNYNDRYSSEKITLTSSEKKIVEKKNKNPYYDDYYGGYGGNFYVYSSSNYAQNKYYPKRYVPKSVPSSSWRYKEPYNYRGDYDYCIDNCVSKSSRSKRERCTDSCRDNYYYQPRWDSQREYYNWRW